MGTTCTKLPKTKAHTQQVNSNSNQQLSPPSSQKEAADDKKAAGIQAAVTAPETTTKESESDETKEYSLCRSNDLHENEMKVFEAGEKQVLVVREKGQVYAMGAKCTHYGAPLNTGVFCKGKMYCPWHGACFSAVTGDIEEFPALDPIPIYPVRVDPHTNEIKVRISPSKLLNGNHGVSKPLSKAVKGNSEVVVIIGSGAAGHSCAETLRQEGFTGRVVIVTKEKHVPYDRTKLSKAMQLDGAKLALRPEEYYKKGDIEIIHEVSVNAVDAESKSILLSNEESLIYSHLVIATGGRPRPIPCPGTHLSNVFLLRTPDDANQIDSTVNKERHVVIVGTSFIGMEVAAYLVDKAASVTVVGRSSTPFIHAFGPIIGKRLQDLHEEKGVRFILEAEVIAIIGDEEGNLTEVKLTTGQTLPADVLLAGLGVVPCTDFLRGSDINLDARGYVPVDKYMRTNYENVYAAGDIASFPMADDEDQQLVNVGHWQMALHMGRSVALTILGRSKPLFETAVPFFWSSMFGKSVRYCGYASDFDDVVIHGDLAELKFAAFLCEKDLVKAVITLNFDPLTIEYAALIGQQRKKLTKQEITSEPKSWTVQLHTQ